MSTTDDAQPTPDAPWWEGAVVYQIYPRSFADANGDGVGDLAGIIERLDHLRGGDGALDVDAIWLSPIFPSPLHDFGYDISDYTDVAPEYGSLADFDALVAACHERGLKILLDLVPCHTSIDHPWFVEARASRMSAKRDWYIWADPPPDGGPPTNWIAAFGTSAWDLDATTGQYYLHSFYPEQPDLNWRNPEVVAAVHDAMRFWLDRGVDGFRVDAIAHAVKDDRLRDNPSFTLTPPIPGMASSRGQEPLWNVDRPEVHDVIRGLRRVTDEYDARVMIGEVYTPVERLAGYLGHEADDEFHLAFNFELLLAEWTQRDFVLAIERSEAHTPASSLPTYALSNHDNPRHATRYGRERSRVAALILLALRGVSVLYAGEEIGMVDGPPLPDGMRFDRAGRDTQRRPMQWKGERHGGFTSGEPWMPLADPSTVNVAGQVADEGSLLALYRRLIRLRHEEPALRRGAQRSIFRVAEDVLAWLREEGDDHLLVLANLADEPRSLAAGPLLRHGTGGEVVIATGDRTGDVALAQLDLEPLEGVIVRLR